MAAGFPRLLARLVADRVALNTVALVAVAIAVVHAARQGALAGSAAREAFDVAHHILAKLQGENMSLRTVFQIYSKWLL